MRAFVTGLTGFIGLHLARRLLGRGWQLRALARDPGGGAARRLAAAGVEVVPGDVTEPETMRVPMAGCQAVIHAAAWYELGVTAAAAARMMRINVDGTRQVLALARELGVARVTHVSSVLAFGDTGATVRDERFRREAPCHSAYEQSKTDAHAVALEFQRDGLPLVIVCPGNVIGPNDQSVWGYFARLYVNHLLPPFAWARQAICAHVAVEDLAEGIALAAERGRVGETYLFAGERNRMGDILGLWNACQGGMKSRLWLSPPAARLMFAPMEPLQRMLGVPAFISRETVRQSSIHFAYSSDKAIRELGWSVQPAREFWPRTLLAERELRRLRRGGALAALLNPLPVDRLPD